MIVLTSRLSFSALHSFLLFALIFPTFAYAQRRPLLRNTTRDHFAGRFVLIPHGASPHLLQHPQLLARVADHELITPPFRTIGKPAEVVAWASEIDFADADGVIFSLDAIAGDAACVKRIRASRPGMPIYGFTMDAARHALALTLVSEGTLDYLLVTGANAALTGEIAARKLDDRVVMDDNGDSAAAILFSRMLNRRFGHSPKIYPVFSAGSPDGVQTETRRIGAKIKTIGCWELPQAANASLTVDAILYVHTPRTSDAQRVSFVENIRQTIEKGGKVGLADLSESKASKDALIAELRSRKLFDRMVSYASADPTGDSRSTGDAISRTAAHVSTLLVAIKFLRDDLSRLRRIDTAQVTLLLNRYLSEWVYALQVRPALDVYAREQLQTDPDRLGANADRAAAFVFERLKPIAGEIFNEQFRRNVHAILLGRGERVVFEVHTLQRLWIRFTTGKSSEAEILLSLHIPQITFPELPRTAAARAEWSLTTNQADERIAKRIDSVIWEDFKTDAESVEVSIKITPQTSPTTSSSESYRILSDRKRRTRQIEVTAPTQQGAFYALAKLEQMGAEGKLAEDFQLDESPSFRRRGIVEGFYGASWSHRDRLDMLRFLGRVRMNRYYYAPKDDPLHRERWRERYSDRGLERFQQLVRTANEKFVELVYAINPGLSITYSSDADLAALIRKLDSMAAIGVKSFALAFDDVPDSLQKPEDRARFKTLAAAQAHVINRIYDHLRQKANGGELTVVPTVYTGARGDRTYLKELGAAIPPDVLVFWTGASVFSPEYTVAQAKEWRSLINRPALVWDNFPVNDDKNWRLFLGPKRGAAPDLNGETAGFIANPMNQPRASWPALATTADYAWDARRYDPSRALESALHFLYDERTRAAMRLWAKVYGDYHHETHLFEPLFVASSSEIALARAEVQLAELQKAVESIGITRDQGLLRGELAAVAERTRQAIERVKSDSAYERLPNGNYQLRK
ncbi:MAG: DUF4127 family protein [Blastocatellia bacterium]